MVLRPSTKMWAALKLHCITIVQLTGLCASVISVLSRSMLRSQSLVSAVKEEKQVV